MFPAPRALYGYRALYLAVAALLIFCVPAANAGPVSPSFECRKAVTPSEKSICNSKVLSELDQTLARRWRGIFSAFSGRDLKGIMRQEQLDWVKERNACGENSVCLKKVYEDRLKHLDGRSMDGDYSGEWRADEVATTTIYKTAGAQYFVAIHASDPTAGAWVCDVEGRASLKSDKLALVVAEHKITIQKASKHQLSIPETEENFSSNANFCGLNGGITFEYTRVQRKP